jgi:hypothetical protein
MRNNIFYENENAFHFQPRCNHGRTDLYTFFGGTGVKHRALYLQSWGSTA